MILDSARYLDVARSRVLTPPERELSEDEFDTAVDRLRFLFVESDENLLQAGELLGRMSLVMLKRVKKLFPRMGRDRIDRLALYGKGLIPAYLALSPQTLTANVLRTLNERQRRQLYDPLLSWPVLTAGGTVMKRLGEMSRDEFMRVVHPGVGLVPIERQALTKCSDAALKYIATEIRFAGGCRKLVVVAVPLQGRGRKSITVEINVAELEGVLGRAASHAAG